MNARHCLSLLRVVIVALIVLIFFIFTSFSAVAEVLEESKSFIQATGPIAAAEFNHFIWLTILVMFAIVPVYIALPFVLIKYRRSANSTDYSPKWSYSATLEKIMWGVPIIIVIIASVMVWNATHDLDPYKPIKSDKPSIEIQTVGLDWKWLFIYPEHGIATVGEAVVPVNHPVAMKLTSDTVMQSFVISSVVGQIYTMAGMVTKLHFIVNKKGVNQGENTQYSGTGFVGQKFKLKAVTEDEFQTWVANVKNKAVPLNAKNYAILAQRNSTKEAHKLFNNGKMPEGVVYFNLLKNENLFNKVVHRYLTTQPLPHKLQPGSLAYDKHIKERKLKADY